MSAEETNLLRSLKHAVFGNGRPGLTDRVTVIETQLSTGSKLLWCILVLSVPNVLSIVKMFIDSN